MIIKQFKGQYTAIDKSHETDASAAVQSSNLAAVQSSKVQRSMTTPRYRFSASRVQRSVHRMYVWFSADDRQEYLDLVIRIGFETGTRLPSRVSDESSPVLCRGAWSGEIARAHVRRSALQFSVKVGG